MPSIQVPERFAVLTVNGGVDGYVTVASNVNFYPGCEAWLSNTVRSQRCIITDLSSTNKIGLRFILEENCGLRFQPPQYGRSDCSAYTLATTSRLTMPAQLAKVDFDYTKILV